MQGLSIPEAIIGMVIAFTIGIGLALAVPSPSTNWTKKQDRLMVTTYPDNW